MRPSEVDHLIGDATKAKEDLGWEPKTSFDSLVRKMVRNDIKLLGEK
jgi:GDPmannose 4,6-dehydratase